MRDCWCWICPRYLAGDTPPTMNNISLNKSQDQEDKCASVVPKYTLIVPNTPFLLLGTHGNIQINGPLGRSYKRQGATQNYANALIVLRSLRLTLNGVGEVQVPKGEPSIGNPEAPWNNSSL